MRTLGSVSLNLSMPLIPFFHGFSVPNPPQAYPGHSKVAVVAAAISGRLLEILGDHGLAGSTWNHTKVANSPCPRVYSVSCPCVCQRPLAVIDANLIVLGRPQVAGVRLGLM